MPSRTVVDAIVVGSGVNALGVVRSLGRPGLRVACIATSPDAPPMRSRFTRVREVAPNTGDGLLDAVARLAEPAADRVPVFLTEEDSVIFLATRQSQLHPRANCRLPDAGVLEKLLDKSSFDTFCRDHGFDVPRTVYVAPGQRPAFAGDLRYPLIVKAATKPADYAQRFKKAYIADDADSASQYAAMIAEATGLAVVQEWIPGGDSQIYFCLQYVGASGPVASFVGQKLASWPPMYGGTASCTAAPAHLRERLSELTTAFFAKAGFQGMGSMEFKVDERSGTAFLIEPTVGRTDFQEEVATVNGVNLPLAAWRYETGAPIGTMTYRAEPRTWMHAANEGTGSLGARLASASRRLSATQAVWRWYDPRPSIGAFTDRARASLHRRLAGSHGAR